MPSCVERAAVLGAGTFWEQDSRDVCQQHPHPVYAPLPLLEACRHGYGWGDLGDGQTLGGGNGLTDLLEPWQGQGRVPAS